MKPSLEDERRALLEQIEASRAVYRRMLTDEPTRSAASGRSVRSRGTAWMLDHPLWVAGGVALLVLMVPRIAARRRRSAAKQAAQPTAQRRAGQNAPEMAARGNTLRALLTVAVLLLRDPARLRAAAQVAGSTWQWLQQRRRARVKATTSVVGLKQI
jgi:hypothetical protein